MMLKVSIMLLMAVFMDVSGYGQAMWGGHPMALKEAQAILDSGRISGVLALQSPVEVPRGLSGQKGNALVAGLFNGKDSKGFAFTGANVDEWSAFRLGAVFVLLPGLNDKDILHAATAALMMLKRLGLEGAFRESLPGVLKALSSMDPAAVRKAFTPNPNGLDPWKLAGSRLKAAFGPAFCQGMLFIMVVTSDEPEQKRWKDMASGIRGLGQAYGMLNYKGGLLTALNEVKILIAKGDLAGARKSVAQTVSMAFGE